jgi:hypothetical protein
LHLRFQFYHVSIDGKLAISMVVDGLSLLRRVHPRFDDLENEEIVFIKSRGIGEALSHGAPRPLGWGRRQRLRQRASEDGGKIFACSNAQRESAFRRRQPC